MLCLVLNFFYPVYYVRVSSAFIIKFFLQFNMSFHPDLLTPYAYSDGILVVEGQRLYVNKGVSSHINYDILEPIAIVYSFQFLAFHSPFFETLFFGEFAEKGKEEIEIKDVSFRVNSNYFSTSIYCLLGDP